MPQQFPVIRLVALDLDGTLLNREGHVTPRTRAALQAAVDKGVYIVPATGRPLASLQIGRATRLNSSHTLASRMPSSA